MTAKPETKRLYEQVAEDLAARIAQGAYAIGDRLPSERDLATAFSVSRPTIREAVIALELDGLVEVKMGSGVYVRARRPTGGKAGQTDIGPFELLEARRAVEGEACAMAALRMTPEIVARLRALVDEMEDENARDVVMSEDADRRFHMAIAEATQNSAMVQAIRGLWDARSRSPQHQFLSQKVRAAGVKPRINEHAAIVEALNMHDPVAARAAMREHLTRVIEALLEATESEAMEEARARVAEQRRRYAATTH
jgi:DNA-binding FadR family transcriptional regulator